MKIARLASPGGPRVARVEGDRLVPYAASDFARIPGLDAPSIDAPIAMAAARLLAPVVPRKVVCIGRNYAAHAKELGNEVPGRPLVFHKPATSVVGPGHPILLPPDSVRVEHEAELGVVVGTRCRHLDPAHALDIVLGYTVINDVTARDLQRADKQFARGKGFDTFCPVGPWIETEFDPSDVRVSCTVGDALRQDGRTSWMLFDVRTILATVSRIMTLEPGDLIATGTPAGVGLLSHGDVVTCSVEGIGSLVNPVADDVDVPPLGPPIGA